MRKNRTFCGLFYCAAARGSAARASTATRIGQQPLWKSPDGRSPNRIRETKTAPVAKPKAAVAATGENGRVVEEIIARVNNDIITKSEYDKALATAAEDAKQECENRCTAQQTRNFIEIAKRTRSHLIDQSLLVQRGKDMTLARNGLIKQLDQIRISNKLGTWTRWKKPSARKV